MKNVNLLSKRAKNLDLFIAEKFLDQSGEYIEQYDSVITEYRKILFQLEKLDTLKVTQDEDQFRIESIRFVEFLRQMGTVLYDPGNGMTGDAMEFHRKYNEIYEDLRIAMVDAELRLKRLHENQHYNCE